MTTLAQQKAVAIAPKITAFASILGSSTAAFLVWKRDTTKTTYHRLVLGMSIVDLIASIAWFFTTWRKCRGFASFLLLSYSLIYCATICNNTFCLHLSNSTGYTWCLRSCRKSTNMQRAGILCTIFSLYSDVQRESRRLLRFSHREEEV